jgi:hypothetical protein
MLLGAAATYFVYSSPPFIYSKADSFMWPKNSACLFFFQSEKQKSAAGVTKVSSYDEVI